MSFREIPLNKPALQAIYNHIGGEKGLREILHDFYARMSQDILIGFFFTGRDIHAIADLQAQFLMRAMGATPSYTGKPPAQAHDALPKILAGHFDRRLRILEATLRDHGLSDEDIRTWSAFEAAFRDAIVEEEKSGGRRGS